MSALTKPTLRTHSRKLAVLAITLGLGATALMDSGCGTPTCPNPEVRGYNRCVMTWKSHDPSWGNSSYRNPPVRPLGE